MNIISLTKSIGRPMPTKDITTPLEENSVGRAFGRTPRLSPIQRRIAALLRLGVKRESPTSGKIIVDPALVVFLSLNALPRRSYQRIKLLNRKNFPGMCTFTPISYRLLPLFGQCKLPSLRASKKQFSNLITESTSSPLTRKVALPE